MEETRDKFAALRRQAEALTPEVEIAPDHVSRQELQMLVEELRVHQVELKLQHEELIQAQRNLEASRDRYAGLYDFAPVGYLTIDQDGIIVEVNRTAARMLARDRIDLLGQKLAHFVAAPDQEAYYLYYRQLIVHGAPASCELRLLGANRSPFYGRLEGVPKPGQDGGHQAWITVSDVTGQKEIEEELQQTQAQLQGREAELTYIHAMLMEEAEEREHAQEKLQWRNQELTLLNNIMAAGGGSLELSDIATSLQGLLAGEMNVAAGAILFYDPAREQLILQTQWQLPPALAAALAVTASADFPLEPVIRRKQSLLWPGPGQAPLRLRAEPDEERPEWRSGLCVPLVAKGEVEGALCLFSRVPAAFSKTQVTFFEILGQQVGVAIQNARLFGQLRRGQQRLRHLAQQVFTAQEKERYRVSRELHDEAGQALTGLKITLEMINADLDRCEDGITQTEVALIQQQMEAAVELCESTMGQIRMLAHDLRPAALENLGLDMTLRSFCRDFGRRTHLAITYEYSGVNLPELPSAVDIALYRILQEALNNVAKHAQANHVRVEFHCDETTISLTVEDDGRGFELEQALQIHNKGQGIGISGMQERLESVGGRLIVSSRPGSGTRLVAWIPR